MNYREAFVKRANTHQTHFEDLILLGPDGIDEFKDKVEKFLATSAGQDVGMNTTTKIDGAPAVICYSKFTGYPDNSICLKSFVANANNVLSSEDEIMAKYGDRPSMAEKLVYCLQLAKLIPEGEAWQGDCLFSTDDKKVEDIRGKEYITFQPNKIVYAFSEENPGYEDVKNAEFGIAFHTVYKDDGNGGKSQSFRPKIDEVLWPNWAYIMSPALNVNKDKFDIGGINDLYKSFCRSADELVADPAYKDLINNEVFMAYWNTFENANIADKKQAELNCETVINDLRDYISEKQTKEFQKKFSSLKTAKGRMGAIDKWAGEVAELKDIIDYSEEVIVRLVETLNAAIEIKMMMWSGFKTSSQDYSVFYKSRTKGIIDANMEGVAMSDADGNIVKIVDRTEFSSANRDPDIMAGWEHPGETLKEGIVSSEEVYKPKGVSYMSYNDFKEKKHYVPNFKEKITKEEPIWVAETKDGKKAQQILIEDKDLVNIQDDDEFIDSLEIYIRSQNKKGNWILKPREAQGEGSEDIKISTDFQEAIQGYLFEHYWNNPLQKDSDYVDTLFSEDFKNRIRWDYVNADFETFKSQISKTLTNKGYASSKSWLSYFIAIAKSGASKIKALYKDTSTLQGAPKAFARGLHSSIDNEVESFFSENILGKPKDRINKADILLVFGANPDAKAKEYIGNCLSYAKSSPDDTEALARYCEECDRGLAGGVLGLSLKKGVNDVHAELLATTTSINKDVFGENAATAVWYYGEDNPENTFISFKKVCQTQSFMSHISVPEFKFSEFDVGDKEGETSTIYVPVNEQHQKEFSDMLKIAIRSNGTKSVTVEAAKHGAKAQLGKWPTVMAEELGGPEWSISKEMSNHQIKVAKINAYLELFKKLYEDPKSDLIFGKLVSSGGYPLANMESGEVKLITAPIIKIS